MPFETIREQLGRAARLHHQLHHRYVTLAALEDGQAATLLDELASQERALARGLERVAEESSPELDAWVQNPRPTEPLPPVPSTGKVENLPAIAAAWDETVAAVYEPLRTVNNQRVQELCEALDAVRTARSRSRARWVTIGYT